MIGPSQSGACSVEDGAADLQRDWVSVVVPAYNEEDAIPSFVDVASAYSATVNFGIEYVFVDDGSQDKTFEVLKSECSRLDCCKIVKLSRNFGSHAAIRAGVKSSSHDRVVVYSVDMPEPIEDIGKMFEELKNGAELAYTLREGYEGGFGSKVFAKLVNRYIEPTYPAEGLVGIGFGPKIKRELNAHPEPNSSVFFQVFQMGFTQKAITAHFEERQIGQSKWTFRKKLKLLIDSFVMFSFAPIRFISAVGVGFAFIGFLWAFAIIVIKLTGAFPLAAGWPTALAVLLIGFGITNVSLGVIAEYLVRDLDATRDRPAFIIDDVIQLKEGEK